MDSSLPPAPTDRCWWLTPSVLGGAYPGAADPAEAKTKVRAILAAGVTLFVDLTTPEDQLQPYAHLLLATEARRVNLPVPDVTVPAMIVLEQAFELLDGETAAGGIAYVHCWGGRGRTGTVLGCWLARDLGGAAALARLSEVRATSADRRQPAPETRDQRARVRRWPRPSDEG